MLLNHPEKDMGYRSLPDGGNSFSFGRFLRPFDLLKKGLRPETYKENPIYANEYMFLDIYSKMFDL